jgi:CDP-diacylglycerol--glycerol-3-phosphate 3-phosphatidyltransferase
VNRQEYRQGWSALHAGVPPRGLVGGWLKVSYALARPLARHGIAPNAVTLTGLAFALLALAPAAAGGRWLLLAVLAITVSGLLDGLDGAVAVLTGRVSRRGAVLDPTCDRLAELSFAGALGLAGAATGWCVAAAALSLLHEQVRASARGSGLREVGVVTVSERPTRVIVAAAFLLAAAVYPGAASDWTTVGAVVWALVGGVGFVQLSIALWARLR